MSLNVLAEVYKVIEDRKNNPKPSSYVSGLIGKGFDAVVAKVEEEAEEFVDAAKNKDSKEIIHEAVDLMFHMFILLNLKNIRLEEILEEFQRRRR
ncbi:MAG: phosphoribosyl-ATP diphosphatase [Candidatus Hecatellales archaeon]|nr:MAG: phosphoribosyl-ATP diphosphatase [Candidatus Hecatellales archaeon]